MHVADSEDEGVRGRVQWLLENVWHGNRTKMARDLTLSHSLIAQVVRGDMKPGSKLISRLANDPRIDGRWLLTGEGEPFALPAEPERVLPVSKYLLREDPRKSAPLLGGCTLQVTSSLYRPSRYLLEIQPKDDRISLLLPGMLLVMEAETDSLPRDRSMYGSIVAAFAYEEKVDFEEEADPVGDYEVNLELGVLRYLENKPYLEVHSQGEWRALRLSDWPIAICVEMIWPSPRVPSWRELPRPK